MNYRRQNIAVLCDASGNATVFSDALTGPVLAVIVTVGTLASTVDMTVTTEVSAQTIVTLTNVAANAVKYPRVPVQDETGANALYAAGGTSLREPVIAANERIKIAVVQGGNAGAGTITLVTG